MSEPITIRQATQADAPVIVTHRRQMFEDMGHADRKLLDAQEAVFVDWLGERLDNGLYRHWFALNDAGEIVAGAGLWLQDWPPGMFGVAPYRGYILNVYTEPNYRKRGLARQLVQTAVDWCHAEGINIVTLHASPQGRPVYEALGFTPTNEMRLISPMAILTPVRSPSR